MKNNLSLIFIKTIITKGIYGQDVRETVDDHIIAYGDHAKQLWLILYHAYVNRSPVSNVKYDYITDHVDHSEMQTIKLTITDQLATTEYKLILI